MIVDLTVPLNENTPVYPGDPKTEITMAGVLDNDGYDLEIDGSPARVIARCK